MAVMFDTDTRKIEKLRKIAEEYKSNPDIKNSDIFKCICNSTVGKPIILYSPSDTPKYWFIPYITDNSVCGFSLLTGSLKPVKVGILGSGHKDTSSFIDIGYFLSPPENLLNDVKSRYSGFNISSPVFSYDRTPSKWAWKVYKAKDNKIISTIYILPTSWYETELVLNPPTDIEG